MMMATYSIMKHVAIANEDPSQYYLSQHYEQFYPLPSLQ